MRPFPLLAAIVVASLAFHSAPAAARMMEPPTDFGARQRTAAGPETGFAPRASFGPSGATVAAARPPVRKAPRRTPRPDPRRQAPVKKVNPAYAGLAAAAGAGGGALIGGTTVTIAAMTLLGVFGAPTLPVTITAGVIAVAVGVATPFLAGLGGGGAILLIDPRTKPGEWSGLMSCATSGCCAGANLIGGSVLSGICGSIPTPNTQAPGIPGPDKPAEWTAAAAVAGLVGGTVVGGLVGWSVAPAPDDPWGPIAIGALAGAVLGSGVAAGAGGALAETIRK